MIREPIFYRASNTTRPSLENDVAVYGEPSGLHNYFHSYSFTRLLPVDTIHGVEEDLFLVGVATVILPGASPSFLIVFVVFRSASF
jgi:hypothetical protein